MPTVTLTVPWVRTSSLGTVSMNTSVGASVSPLTSFDQTCSLRTVTANTDRWVLVTNTMTYTQAMSAQLCTVDFDFTFVVHVAFTLTASPGIGRDLILVRGRPFVFHSLGSQLPFMFHQRTNAALPMVFHKRGVEIITIEQVLTPLASFDDTQSLFTPRIAFSTTALATTMTYAQDNLTTAGVSFDFTVV